MTPSQQVKLFCKQNGLNADTKNKVLTVSKRIIYDEWFIECFDNYKEALEYFTKHTQAYTNKGVQKPWEIANVK